MKKILFIPLIALLSVGCVKKTITLSSANQAPQREVTVPRVNSTIYEESVVYEPESQPRYEERVVYHPQTQPQYEEPTTTPTQTVVETSLDPITAYDMLQGNPMVMLLDVRTKQEQRTDGKIANSLLIPLEVLSKNFNKLDRAKKIMVYCHTGNRSQEALNILFRNGFDAVEIKGGIQKWKASHLPVRYGR
jgi:rhodanese-related sulfurtransferase